jgi:signal transduction histidine kinase
MLIAAAVFLSHDPLARQDSPLVAAAVFLLASSRLQYMCSATGANSLTMAATVRLAAYAVLLTAAIRELTRARRDASAAELLAERRRIAHDLHDGLAQDLAFIASYAERLASGLGVEHPLTIASKRALAVSRGKIMDLTASSAPTTAAALKQIAEELERRHHVDIAVEVDERDTDPGASKRGELVRIAREAIVNAVRHGGAQHINVRLGSPETGHLLSVVDDGCGLEAASQRATGGTGLGMVAMRSAARTLGGDLIARSAPGGGTQLEVVVPCAIGINRAS